MLEFGRSLAHRSRFAESVSASSSPLSMTGLESVMARESGRPELLVAVLDGPVQRDHPALSGSRLVSLSSSPECHADGAACGHGTAVAGMLVARRDSPARGICPEVRLLVRPIFTEAGAELAPADVLAEAIVDCINAGARLINISAAFTGVIPVRQDGLGQALAHAARRGVIVVAAAGNESRVGGSPLLSHPWVIPVTSTDLSGHPLANTNMGQSIGRHGLSAPGTGITSLSAGGGFCPFGGTSAAAPLVTGALALAWSAELATPAGAIRAAVGSTRRRSLVPPSLDARAIYQKVTGRQP